MKFRTLGRHFQEAFRSFWRNGGMTFSSISTVAITLLILGIFLILNLNLENWTKGMERQVEIRAFIKMETSDAEIERLKARIEKLPEVSDVKFISREQGLEELKSGFGKDGYLLDDLRDENPLPHSFLIKTLIPQETPKVAGIVEQYEAIDKVRYGSGMVEELFKITDAIRNFGLVLIIGQAFTAMFLISNSIKLAIVSRRKEIEVMKLVGATNSFIRWPFFIEGLLLGLIGAVIPLGILLFGYNYIVDNVTISFIYLIPLEMIWEKLTLLLLGIGVFIGIWGSITSVRKFLRV